MITPGLKLGVMRLESWSFSLGLRESSPIRDGWLGWYCFLEFGPYVFTLGWVR